MKLRLMFWLGCMWACEVARLTDCEIYYWFTRRAAGCIAWRKS
jgi:hypothetical protein